MVLLWEGATALASTVNLQRTLAGLFADDAKQFGGRDQFCRSYSALQQRVEGCPSWLVYGKKVMKGKKGWIGHWLPSVKR